jgi:putative peptide zinc metalloprotease protein
MTGTPNPLETPDVTAPFVVSSGLDSTVVLKKHTPARRKLDQATGKIEVARVKLSLRNDLVFTPQSSLGDPHYLVEDPIHSRFYRVGLREYAFLSLLDGKNTVNDAVRIARDQLGGEAITEQEAVSICRWLVGSELVQIDSRPTAQSWPASGVNDSRDATRSATNSPAAAASNAAQPSAWSRWNLLYLRIPLVHPDRIFQAAHPWLRWVNSRRAFVVWLVAVLAAGWQLAARWGHFTAATEGMLAPSNWLWLTACWVLLKLAHEFAHGLACKHYGGSVREAGVMLMFFAPVAYVDVTTSWRFRSKWQRIHIAAAGMIAELFIAALATLVWSCTEPGPLNLLAFNAIVMASITTVLFNANPLMRFDGYYILSDLLEIPNLYALGQQSVSGWFRRWVLGLPTAPSGQATSRQNVIRGYGWLSLVWRVVTLGGILIASTVMFRGAGIVLTIVAAAMWLGVPAIRFARFIWNGSPTEQPDRLRFVTTASLAGGAVAALLAFVPWPLATRAPAIVEYSPLTIVRTASAGFVREIRVSEGQAIQSGDVLAVLENAELELELADLDLAILQSQLKARVNEKNQHVAAHQAEMEHAESLAKKRQEKLAQVNGLTVRSPISGRVLDRSLDALVGRYFSAGSELVSIGAEDQKDVQVAISQDHLDVFAANVRAPVTIRLPGGDAIGAVLEKVSPRASLTPPHPSLCAPQGGPLAVRQVAARSGESRDHGDNYELLAPGFRGVVALDGPQASALRAGQRGVVTARAPGDSIGRHLYGAIERWVQKRLNPQQRT